MERCRECWQHRQVCSRASRFATNDFPFISAAWLLVLIVLEFVRKQAKTRRALLASEQVAAKADTSAIAAEQRAVAAEEKLARTEVQLTTLRKEAENSQRVRNTEGRAYLALKARTLCRSLTRREQRVQQLSGALHSMRRNAATAARQQVQVAVHEQAARGEPSGQAARQAAETIRMGLVVKLWSACSVIQRLIEAAPCPLFLFWLEPTYTWTGFCCANIVPSSGHRAKTR